MVVSVLIAVVAALLVFAGITSCGTTKTYVNNRAAGTSTSVTVTNSSNNSTSFSVTTVLDLLNGKENEKQENALESKE